MHWIIGTAGHIDHGKTSLVKALTGQDTDRLKEERERGISIDLGFAYLELSDGSRAGVVDVPGHERFIRNMLAGAHGIDLVLFTVAADDGVMPQTREHLDILHLLGLTRAIFVLTKADLVTEDRLREVAEEVRRLIARTSLEGARILPFSFVTGDGLDPLRVEIDTALRDRSRPLRDGYFRLPIDRAFTSPGHGLIVTGTAVSGEVRPGDALRLVPGGEVLRVRGVEVHNESVDVATWGQRVALNLTGQTRMPIVRGDVVCHESISLTCDRFDARIEVRPAESGGLEDHQRVHVHIGTAERMGKVIPLGSRQKPGATEIAPGEIAYCQISLSEPLLAMRGDRVILRDASAQRTIGGGVVLLPAPARHKRGDPALIKRLETLDHGDLAQLVEALLEERGAFVLPLAELAELLNGREEDIRDRLEQSNAVHAFSVDGGLFYASERACHRAKSALHETLFAWHAAHPLAAGVDLEEARLAINEPVPLKVFRLLVQELSNENTVVREGSLLRLAGHRIVVPDADRDLVDRLIARLRQDPMSPPDAKQLAAELGVDRGRVADLMRAMERQRSLVGVAPDLYFLSDAVEQVRADLVRDLAATTGITTGQFRDRYKTSRKYTIPLLEHFDRIGVTVRIGAVRRLKHPGTGAP